jgi:two-component system NarL family sensor kinase
MDLMERKKIMESSRALQVYRIVQELLNNSIKHSKGNEILVQLSLKEPDLEIIVEDDGIGYQTDHVNKGMGLENIKSRIKYLKGEISIKSRPNEGTSTLIQVPVKG